MKTIDAVFALQAQQHASHNEMVTLVNKGFADIHAAMAAHAEEDVRRFGALETRIGPIEETRRTLRTALGAIAVQVLVFLGGVVMVMWKVGVR